MLLSASCHAAMVGRQSEKALRFQVGRSKKALRFQAPPVEPKVLQPLDFDQQLLICNAYPGDHPVTVKQNGHEAQADQRNIRFRECRRMTSRVHAKDKLDFVFANSGIQGTFELEELPATDALLLLVVEKRDAASQLVAFQSFAFPSRVEGSNAQLAVIDTYKGNSSSAHLRMEDHVSSNERKTISKRVEQLNFNRIYAIEAGTYDTSISDHILEEADSPDVAGSRRTMRLLKKQNYVILRTGDEHLHQSLVVFPELPQSASAPLAASLAVLIATFATVFS